MHSSIAFYFTGAEGCQTVPLLYAHGFQEELSFRCVTLSLTHSSSASSSSSSSNFQPSIPPSIIILLRCMASTCSAPAHAIPRSLRKCMCVCGLHFLPPSCCFALWFVGSLGQTLAVEGQHRGKRGCGVVVTWLWEWGQEQLWGRGGNVSEGRA